jgi:hypothetical protein
MPTAAHSSARIFIKSSNDEEMTMRPFRSSQNLAWKCHRSGGRDELHVLEDLDDPRGIPRECVKGVPGRIGPLFGKAYPAEPGLRVLNDIDYEIFAKRVG